MNSPKHQNIFRKENGPVITRNPVDCPMLVALIAYLDHGDEADLFAAVDMLIDAGKFDPE